MTTKSKIIIGVSSAVYVLDRLTKMMVVDIIGLDQSLPVIREFFHLTHVHNTGAAFGIFARAQDHARAPFFIITTLAAIALLAYFVARTDKTEKLVLAGLAMIIGGAAGNLTDRVLYGYVIDFIDWHVGSFHWPAFNVADSGITVGIAILGIELFVRGKPAVEKKDPSS